MKLLLDSHVLLWAAYEPYKLPKTISAVLIDEEHDRFFSVASVLEIVIKVASGRSDFNYDVPLLRRNLIRTGYQELPITGEHALRAGQLPSLHKDPFDRILIAQAQLEDMILVTADEMIKRYPGLQTKLP